jgi:hypothetical protein
MKDLAVELWEMIAMHIDTTTYHNLRASSQQIRLGICHTVTKPIYMDQVQTMIRNQSKRSKKNLRDYHEYIRIDMKRIDDRVFLFLSETSQFRELERALKQLDTISDDAICNAFSIMVERANIIQMKMWVGQPGIDFDITKSMAKRIFQSGRVNPIQRHQEPIRHFARYGDVQVVQALLNTPNVDPSCVDCQAVLLASESQHDQVLQLLLPHMLVRPWYPFLFEKACIKGYSSLVSYLIKHIDPTFNNQIAFVNAVTKGHSEIVQILLDDGRIDPADNGNAALELACGYGHASVVQLLLEDSRVSIHTTNNAITFAAMTNQIEVIKVMLPKLDTKELDQVIDCAIEMGHETMIRLIQEWKLNKQLDP